MTQIDDKALEAAVLAHDKEEAAMRGEPDPWADERPEDEFADRKAAMALAIRSYLSASDAEREPFCWIPTATAKWLEEYDGPACATQTVVHNRPIKSDGGVPLYAAPLPLTDLEAENARLKAEVERLRELASELPIVKYALRATEARLAEALKALEPFAKVAPVFDHQRLPAPCEDHHTVYKWETKGTGEVEITVADFRAARRVREGGK